MLKKILLGATLVLGSSAATAEIFMDEAWANNLCEAWNKNTVLTEVLGAHDWMKNNSRGYKLIQMHRTSCGEETQIQLRIDAQNGKAICTFGGLPDGQVLDKSVDYQMHASDRHWGEMGQGVYGPFKALMFGYLNVKGPYDEAMYALTPFGEFLRLAGSVPGEKGENKCPAPQI